MDFLAERHAVELVGQRLVEPFANPIGLRALRFRPGVIHVFYRQVQLVLVAVRGPAVLRPPIGEHPIERNAGLLEERHHPIIEQVGGRQRGLAIRELGEPGAAVGVTG